MAGVAGCHFRNLRSLVLVFAYSLAVFEHGTTPSRQVSGVSDVALRAIG